MTRPLSARLATDATCEPAERAYQALAEMLIDAAERMRRLAASGEGKVKDAA
jgi:hemoglobin-like flavoprotein